MSPKSDVLALTQRARTGIGHIQAWVGFALILFTSSCDNTEQDKAIRQIDAPAITADTTTSSAGPTRQSRSERSPRDSSLSIYADAASKLATTLALLIGGGWAVYKFRVLRMTVWNLQVRVDANALPYRDELKLVCFTVFLTNIGKVKVLPGSKGCTITIREVPPALLVHEELKWEDCRPLISATDIIARRFENPAVPGYEIEPGTEYQEIASFILAPRGIVMVETRFWWKDDRDTITNYRFVDLRR